MSRLRKICRLYYGGDDKAAFYLFTMSAETCIIFASFGERR